MLDQALNDALSRVGSGTPMGVAPTYYNIRAAEGMFPKGEAWRESLVSRMHS